MSQSAHTCLKCGGAMVEGFVTDFAHSNVKVAEWHEGTPVPGWFWEVRPDKSLKQRKTTALRCRQCGFLEWYALGDIRRHKVSAFVLATACALVTFVIGLIAVYQSRSPQDTLGLVFWVPFTVYFLCLSMLLLWQWLFRATA